MLFAIAYALVQLVHMTAYFVAAGSDTGLRRQIIITESSAFLPTVALLVIGGLAGAPLQVWIWLVAVTFQWVMIYVTSSGGDWRIKSAAHFAERHGLVVLLALGESVIAIGSGVAQLPLSGMVLLGSGLGLGIGIGLWWAYFHHAAPRIESAVARQDGVKRSELATQVYTYLHFPLIAGVVIVALGIETSVGHVADSVAPGLFSAVALGSGAALYLATTGLIWLRVSGEWALPRFGVAALLLIAIPVLAIVPAAVALTIVFVLVVGLAVAEGLLGQRAKVPSKKAVTPASTPHAE
jgi:low temperature requirement protein LtrA